jgi:hypothetical protein
LDCNAGLTIQADRFSASLALKFLQWAGYKDEFLAIDPSGRRALYLDNDLEYILYSRDPTANEFPFSKITDSEIVDVFFRDLKEFGIENLAKGLYHHIDSKLIARCEEYRAWRSLQTK